MIEINPNTIPETEPGNHPLETPPPHTEPMPDSNEPVEVPEIHVTHSRAAGEDAAMTATGVDIADDRPEHMDNEQDGDNDAEMAEDVPDLIDTMEQMHFSGTIDYGAFKGERNDDDGASTYGRQ